MEEEEEESIPQKSKATQILKVATMSSFGGFREGEIDGKSFLIFTFLTQPDNLNPSSSSSSSLSRETTTVSGGSNNLVQPLFICPTLRKEAAYMNRKKNGLKRMDLVTLNISPHFPSSDQQVHQYLLSNGNNDFGRKSKFCKLPVLPLFWCNNQESAESGFECTVCKTSDHGSTNYYYCVTCDEKFHKECVESPSEIKYPSYPFLSFQLSYPPEPKLKCLCCKASISFLGYHCPTPSFGLHPVCARKPISFVIDHPKRHPHPLTFFPKQAFLPCNVCGLIIESIPTYLCVPCIFVVHQDCIDFPNVIKISRHSQHRISFTYFLPSGKWSCGVCRKEVDNNYGAYSCSKCDGYFVHTRCALRRDLWDGEELEGVPEEPEIVVPPFERIADGIIRHFSHGHLLKLENNKVEDEDKFCSACVLPIYEGNNYSCMDQCDFILHEVCANAPRKKHNPLHAHPLTLKVVTDGYGRNYGYFNCNACRRKSSGFVYESEQGGRAFKLDLRCALVSEPFEHQVHEHPLFLALKPKEERAAKCQICQEKGTQFRALRKLNCIECDYVICFTCATLPYKTWYKHDKHLLTFNKEKEESDELGWCELCEKELVYSGKGGFYTCDNYCGTTLHVDCLLGRDPYMRPGQSIDRYRRLGKTGNPWGNVHIVRNNTMSRPICHFRKCDKDRCPYRVFFQKENKTYCSHECAFYG